MLENNIILQLYKKERYIVVLSKLYILLSERRPFQEL